MVGTQRKSRGDKNKTNIDTETISGRKFLDGKERGPSENCCRKGRETSNWKMPLGWVVGQQPPQHCHFTSDRSGTAWGETLDGCSTGDTRKRREAGQKSGVQPAI